MQCVIDILRKFCFMSRKKVCSEKSIILFSLNLSRLMRFKLTHMSGFKKTTQFGKYLGVPLSGKTLKKGDYQYLVEQVNNRLAN